MPSEGQMIHVDQRSAAIEQAQPSTLNPILELQMQIVRTGDLARLEKLLDLEGRWRAAEAKRAYNEAFAKFKAVSLHIKKNKHVQFDTKAQGKVDYWHATLASICEQACPALASFGLRHHWILNELEDGKVKVTCFLTHELGYSESTSLSDKPFGTGLMNTVQQKASLITYLERYTFLSITGLATIDQDDDARSAQPPQEQSQPEYHMENEADWQSTIEGSGSEEELDSNYWRAMDAAHTCSDPKKCNDPSCGDVAARNRFKETAARLSKKFRARAKR